MINLLDNNTKKQHRAARMNLRLRNYYLLLFATLLGVIGIFVGSYMLTLNERSLAAEEVKTNKQRVVAYEPTRTAAENFASNLKIAKSILSQEVLFSDMIIRITKTLPGNAVLSSLTLQQDSLAEPFALMARVPSKNDVIPLKSRLDDSPIFENVSINSIAEEEITDNSSEIEASHPVVVTLTVTLSTGEGSLLP